MGVEYSEEGDGRKDEFIGDARLMAHQPFQCSFLIAIACQQSGLDLVLGESEIAQGKEVIEMLAGTILIGIKEEEDV